VGARGLAAAIVSAGLVVAPGNWSANASGDSTPVPTTTEVRSGAACPQSFSSPAPVNGDGSLMLAEQSRLEPMLGAVLAYGGEHPDVFAGHGLAWNSSDDASVFVAFSGDVEAHRQALEATVEFPDELIVCRAVLSDRESAALLAELGPLLDGRVSSWGGEAVDGAIIVDLLVSEEAYADELLARFGELVHVNVGAFPYPMPDPLPESRCETLGDPQAVDGLEITLDPIASPITMSTMLGASVTDVRLRNVGEEVIRFTTGQPLGLLVQEGDRTAVNFNELAMAALGIEVDLPPHGEQTIALSTGLASCDPAVGYRVPAGSYDLIAVLAGPVIDAPPLLSQPLRVHVD
jgi:hypothetical protein